MTANRFGGVWTEEKLNVLREYLQFYCVALKNQPYKLVYIDAFAGTGRCKIKPGDTGADRVIDGSAKIALDCSPGFHEYRFIEAKKKHQEELQQLIDAHPRGTSATIGKRKAEDVLEPMLLGYNWNRTRGVLFLDPFGLQCSYRMLQAISSTKALDVFFLVSLAGLYRQAAVVESNIDEGKAAKLTNFLGTAAWRDAMYSPPAQSDLFGEQPRQRERGWEAILQFTTNRLEELFPYVGEPNLIGSAKGAPLFALYFAVANDSKPALALATKVSKEILSRLQR